jgi:hypothetical protein
VIQNAQRSADSEKKLKKTNKNPSKKLKIKHKSEKQKRNKIKTTGRQILNTKMIK